MFLTSLLCLVVAQVVVGGPIQSRAYTVKETHPVPRKWKPVGAAPKNAVLNMHIGLKQSQFSELERHLLEVSDPFHDRYGQHLTADEVNELIKPCDDSLDLVHEWLADAGIDVSKVTYSPAKDWIEIALPVDFVEFLLQTKYSTYENEDGQQLVRTSEFSLPFHLHEHIDVIQPTTSFFNPVKQKAPHRMHKGGKPAPTWIPPNYSPPSNATLNAVCDVNNVTPECFATLYSTKGYVPKATDKNAIAINNFLMEVPIRPDLKMFLDKYVPSFKYEADIFPQISIAGGPTNNGTLTEYEYDNGLCGEADLDIQTIAGISHPTPIITYETGGSPPYTPDQNTPSNTNEPYLVWVSYLLAQKKLPGIVSTSYDDDEQTVPFSYAQRVCQAFAQVGVRGTTLFFSSGDSGVGGDDSCLSNDGKNRTEFTPNFPSSCNYVTSVGGTMRWDPEVAVYEPPETVDGNTYGFYASGAGFSNYFPRPAYQDNAVPAYIASLKGAHDGLYNKNGRGYPDLSAQSLNFAIVYNETFITLSGTSASAPLTAGIFALVNDALLAKGKPTLGFLNPWLYAIGHQGLTDITSGNSPGCNTDGFPTSRGWDASTGWGTPIFPKLVELALRK